MAEEADAPPSPKSRKVRNLVAIGIFILLAAILNPFGFGYYSVCSTCGLVRESHAREIPLLPVPYWTSHRYRQTRLSAFLAEHGLLPSHRHAWAFAHGNGNWRSGSGRGMFLEKVANSPDLMGFLQLLIQYTDAPTTAKWSLLVFSQGLGDRVLMRQLAVEEFPEKGFGNRAEFEKWWRSHAPSLEEAIRRETR